MPHEVRGDEQPARSQDTVDLCQGQFWFRHHVQGVGDENDVKRIRWVGQRGGISHGKRQLRRITPFLASRIMPSE